MLESYEKHRKILIHQYKLSEDATDEEINFAAKRAHENYVNKTVDQQEIIFIRKALQIPNEVSDSKIRVIMN